MRHGIVGHQGLLLAADVPPGGDAYTVLHLHCDGSDGSTTIVDSSPSGRSPYDVSGASISTAQSVFGGASLYLTGGGGVRFPADSAFNLGTQDFELSFWIRLAANGVKYVFGQYDNSGLPSHQSIGVLLQTNKMRFYAMNGSTTLFDVESASSLTVGAWAFFAFTRVGTAFTVVQGSTPGGATAVVGSGASSAAVNNASGRLGVGRLGDYSAANVNAYVDELRFRVGAAASFSVCPSAPF